MHAGWEDLGPVDKDLKDHRKIPPPPALGSQGLQECGGGGLLRSK